MNIAILGTGAIGSAFAYQLAKAGHSVTTIARGKREQQLRRDNGVVLSTGERATVEVAGELDVSRPYDLVLVTVLAPQVAAVLPALQASAAKQIMFMFNTFESLEPLSAAVRPERFLMGFPMGILGRLLDDGSLKYRVQSGTTVGDSAWAKTFTDAGIKTDVELDMHSWLRAHAALVIPLMASALSVVKRGGGNTWSEAGAYADAFDAGFRIVRELGHPIRPGFVAVLAGFPTFVLRFVIWAMSRTQMQRELGLLGPAEPRMLIDMMTAAAPGKTAQLIAIRP